MFEEEAPAPRQPPANAEIESALLGAILTAPNRLENVADFLRAEHFYDDLHNLIFSTMLNLSKENKKVDMNTVGAMLKGSSMFEDAGKGYLAGLQGQAITTLPEAVRNYGEVLVDLSTRRQLIQKARELTDRCYLPVAEVEAREILDQHESALLKLTGLRDASGGLMKFKDVLDLSEKEWEAWSKGAAGVPTGFTDLDNLIGGLHTTDLIILAARASMGKSSLAVNIAFNAAHYFKTTQNLEYKGKQVAFFTLEMSASQLGGRIITGQTSIVSPRNRWGKEMTGDEWQRVWSVAKDHGDLPFWVDETADQTIARMRARCVRLHRKRPLGLIVIDYIQLMSGDTKARAGNRVEEISQITRNLKKMAKELHVPIIALSQLSRAVEQRENKRPMLSDLRESGSIEQDSDIVLFPYRPQYYMDQEGAPVRKSTETDVQFSVRTSTWHAAYDQARGRCEIIVAKQRHGPLGSAWLTFDSGRTWFENEKKPGKGDEQETFL